ncbi:MAG: hypothetical protein ACOYBC_03310 [Bilifractor sp.]
MVIFEGNENGFFPNNVPKSIAGIAGTGYTIIRSEVNRTGRKEFGRIISSIIPMPGK